ncbi:MAG: hypothetical protein JKY50_22660 [Oleispira sp.]|nr:hypothetical protein [Oleispira sp.]
MITEENMYEDHFVIDADSLPLDMFRQIPDPFPGCDMAIYFHENGVLEGCWWKGIELKIDHTSGMIIYGWLKAYGESLQRELAENST